MLFPLTRNLSGPHRVVITGAGIVTSLGIGWAANTDGFREGRTAFRPVTRFDVSRQRAGTAAEVDLPDDPPPWRLPGPLRRRLDHATKMLLFAAHEAWAQAGWK